MTNYQRLKGASLTSRLNRVKIRKYHEVGAPQLITLSPEPFVRKKGATFSFLVVLPPAV